MTPEEKVAMLKKAGVWDVIGFPSCIDKLFDLVAAHEREKQASAVCIGYWNQKTGAFYKPMQVPAAFEKMLTEGILRKCYAAPVSIESAVLAEREACAKVCDEHAAKAEANGYTCKGETFIDGFGDGSGACAAAIRARGDK